MTYVTPSMPIFPLEPNCRVIVTSGQADWIHVTPETIYLRRVVLPPWPPFIIQPVVLNLELE